MKLNKQIIVAGIVTTVAAGTIAGMGVASAQTTNGQSGLVDKLVTKFNLNRNDVESVIQEVHDEKHAEMEVKEAEHLQELVDAGTITADQKTALETKRAEMEATRNDLKNQGLTKEEMRTKMDEARTEFETWAKDQAIDLSIIKPQGGHGHRGEFGGKLQNN